MNTARPRHADARTARQVALWRRHSARLGVLLQTQPTPPALAAESFALQRQCERLAGDLRALAVRTSPARDRLGRQLAQGPQTPQRGNVKEFDPW